MERRSFLGLTFGALPALSFGQSQPAQVLTGPTVVRAGQDRFGDPRGLGITSLAFKVATGDAGGGLFVIEQTSRTKGGPARHLHYEQEEWFYALEGAFAVEVGGRRVDLKPGDSLLAPRRVAHTWAYTGDGVGRLLIAFTPAGQMEAFFREVTKANAMPPQNPGLWRAYGMELVGPPLSV
jgi:mannose-6-phosphate isomerase-like protein (cupin superfamily)